MILARPNTELEKLNTLTTDPFLVPNNILTSKELNYQETNDVFDAYLRIKPEIVVTHDCPASVAEILFGMPTSGVNKQFFKSTTRELLQGLFEEHQPRLHLFGHHHKSKDMIINGTRFICLAELETYNL